MRSHQDSRLATKDIDGLIKLLHDTHANGQRPNIENLLADHSIEGTFEIFVDLLSCEVEADRQRGNDLRIKDYLSRYPHRRREIELVIASILKKSERIYLPVIIAMVVVIVVCVSVFSIWTAFANSDQRPGGISQDQINDANVDRDNSIQNAARDEVNADVLNLAVDLTYFRSLANSQRPIIIAILPSTPAIVRDIVQSQMIETFKELNYTPLTIFKPEFYSSGAFDQVWLGDTTLLAKIREIDPIFGDVVLVRIEFDQPILAEFDGFQSVRGSLSLIWLHNESSKLSDSSTQRGVGTDERSALVACTEKLAEAICRKLHQSE